MCERGVETLAWKIKQELYLKDLVGYVIEISS